MNSPLTLLIAALALAAVERATGQAAAENWTLLPAAASDSEGVFLNQLAAAPGGAAVPALRLGASPAWGQAMVLHRAQIQQALVKAGSDLSVSNWLGADRVRVTRRARTLGEGDVKDLLAAALQQEFVKDRGELELRLTRPWAALSVPDEPLQVRLLDLPASGLSAMFIVRFEIRTRQETIGSWQAPVSVRVWREIWVARSALRRGQSLAEADLVRERRDVLPVREGLAEFAAPDASWEISEGVIAGMPLAARHVRLRPVVFRGQSAEGIVQDGSLNVGLRVEVLEDGAPGQVIRIRNPLSRRELRGKVQNEQTIQVLL